MVWICSKKYSTNSIKTKWKLNLGVDRFKLLGITFDTNLDKMLTLNFTDKISNIKTKINYWNRRSLIPIGRIAVIKSLLLSSLNHLFISLPNHYEKLLKDLNELFFNFIWTGTSRIKKTVLCQEYCNGGFKMVNINAFIAALKTTWLRKIITDNNSPWSIILQSMTDTKKRFQFRDTLYNGKNTILKFFLERCILISYTNCNKEHTNRDTTIPNHSNFLQRKHQNRG